MEDSELGNTQHSVDAREEAHVRSFTKWINVKISKAKPEVEVTDLFQDLRDGKILITLLEVLLKTKLPREKGVLRVHHRSNVNIVIRTLTNEKVKLHGISVDAIIDGVRKSTLGLVWSIILFQVHGSIRDQVDLKVSSVARVNGNESKPVRKKNEAKNDGAVEDKMLQWVNGSLIGYDDLVEVKDLSKSWRNGLAFNALIHAHRNDLVNLRAVESMSNKDRLDHAFNVAEKDLHVQKLLEPSDVDQPNPDKKLVMMYVSSLSEALAQYQPVKRVKKTKIVEEVIGVQKQSDYESSVPSEVFASFKESLEEVSALFQETENEFTLIEKKREIDVKAWQNYENELQFLESGVNKLQEDGEGAMLDPLVSPTEAEEMRADLVELEKRWSVFRSRIENQRQRIKQFQEGKFVEHWRKQSEIYFNWIKKMNDHLETIEKMDTQDNLSALGDQARELQRLGQVLNTDPFPQQTFDVGHGLLAKKILQQQNQIEVKEQLEAMQKQLEDLRSRASKNIDKLNNNIDAVKTIQTDQLAKWRKQAEAMCDWLDTMDDKLESLGSKENNQNIKEIVSNIKECEALQETIKNDEKPHSIMDYGETLVTENAFSKEQKSKIEKQLKEMKNEWLSLIEKITKLKKSLLNKREVREREEKDRLEEWIIQFEKLIKQLTAIKEKLSQCSKQVDVQEKEKLFQECASEVEAIRSDYKNAVLCADRVIANDVCPEWEMSQVKDDLSMLKTAWTSVLDDMDKEEKSIKDSHDNEINKQIEIIQQWRTGYNDIGKWYIIISSKIEGEFTMGKTLPEVQKQIAIQKELLNEMVTTHEKVEYLLSSGKEILRSPNTPENEKIKLRKDIANLVERWESLSDPVNNRMERLNEMEKHFQAEFANKLDEWRNIAITVELWLTKSEKKFQALGGIAPNLEAAIKQKPRAEVLAKEVKQEEKKLANATRVGEEILTDGYMSDEDNAKLQQELNTLRNRWAALDEKIKWRVTRLDETITKLGSQQEDKLEKWRQTASEISDWLDKAQLRLAERGPIGSDLKAVTAQKEVFQEFVNESLLFQRHIYEFTEFGENLRTDPCINEEERAKVQQKTKSLNDRWDTIVKQINNHDNALENRIDELEEKHQTERLSVWKTKSEPLQKWLTAKAIEAKSMKEIGNDLITVQKQLADTKVLRNRIDNHGKQFRECLTLAEEIQKDELIEDEKAKDISDLATDMTNRWSALKYGLDSRMEKLLKKEKAFQNEKSNKISQWSSLATTWKLWLKERETKMEKLGPIGNEPRIIKSQRAELQSLNEEFQSKKPELDDALSLGDEALKLKSITDDDRRQIQQDRFLIKNQWDSQKDSLEWQIKRHVSREAELNTERTTKIHEWESKVATLQDWIHKKNTKADNFQTTPDDLEVMTTQINEVQVLLEETGQKEKQLASICRLGEDILQSPLLSDEDRPKLNNEITMIQEEWRELSEKLHSTQERLINRKRAVEEQKKTKLEEWSTAVKPFERWLIEESSKFNEQSTNPGANIELVKTKRQETEQMFDAMLANEEQLNKIEGIHEDSHSHSSLSVEDKKKLLQEMNRLRSMWKALQEKMEAAVKRITNKENELEKERNVRLSEWKKGEEEINNWMNEREYKLKDFDDAEATTRDLDHVKKKIKNIKILMDGLHTKQKEYRVLMRSGDETQSHPSLYERDRVTVSKELAGVKSRWKTLEGNVNELFKGLTEEESQFLEARTSDLTEWKDGVSPVKEWINKQQQKMQSHTSVKDDHDSVVKQKQDIEIMLAEWEKKQESLEKLQLLQDKLQSRACLSEEDKKRLRQEYNNVKTSLNDLEDEINETRRRISNQESSFSEERLVKMEEWRCKSAPIEQLFSEQGTKWEDDEDLESTDYETLRKHKQSTQADIQLIQKQQVELENAIRAGEEIQQHTSLKGDDRSKVRMEMSNLKSQWQNLEERMHRKKKRLSFREIVLSDERSSKLGSWKNEMNDIHEWLSKQEKKLISQGEPGLNLDSVQKLRSSLESQLEEVKAKEKQLEVVIEKSNSIQTHASLSEEDRKTIEQDVTTLANEFKNLMSKIEEKMKRVSASEKKIRDEIDSKLHEWQTKLAAVEDWFTSENEKLDKDKQMSDSIDVVIKQRREMEDGAKEMELQEKRQLTGMIRYAEDLTTDETLSNEDRRTIQENIETLKNNWENLGEKMKWKIKRLSEIEGEYREQEVVKMQEWRNTLSPLQEWLTKEDEKIQESIASDVTNVKRQKQECTASRKDMELQKKRLNHVISFGNDINQHPSVSQENRKNIEQCMAMINNDWEQLDNKLEWRMTSIEEREAELYKERSSKMDEWKTRLEGLECILEDQETSFKAREGVATDLETVRDKKAEIEDMIKELEFEQRKELESIIKYSEHILEDPAMSGEDSRKIKQDVDNLKNNFENLEEKMKWRVKRLSEKENELEEFRIGKLAEWKSSGNHIQTWIAGETTKYECCEDLSNDLDELREQKTETEELLQDMEGTKSEVNNLVQMGDQLLEHPSLIEEDRKQVEHQLETIQNNWHMLFTSISKRSERIVTRESELDIEVSRVSMEWRSKIRPIREWINEAGKTITEDSGIDIDLDYMRRQKREVEGVAQEMDQKEEELRNVVKFAYAIQENPLLSHTQKENIKNDSSKLNEEWDGLETAVEERTKIVNKNLRNWENDEEAKLCEWRDLCKPLSDWLMRADRVIHTTDVIDGNIEETRKRKNDIETLLQDAMEMKPKFSHLSETCEQMQQEPCLSQQDRKNIQNDAERISNQFLSTMQRSEKQRDVLSKALGNLENRYREEKLGKWGDVSNPIFQWISAHDQKIQSLETASDDITSVTKQKEETQRLLTDITAYKVQVESLSDLNTELSDDPLVNDEITDMASLQTKNIKNKWRSLNEKIQSRSESLSMKLTKLLNDRQRLLARWYDKITPISEWVAEKQQQLSGPEKHPSDIDMAIKEKNDHVDLVVDLETQKQALIEISENDLPSLQNPAIADDERRNVERDFGELQNSVDALTKKAKTRETKLKERVRLLQSQQKDKLEEWKHKMKEVTKALTQAESIVTEESVVGANIESVKNQKEGLQDVLSYCLHFQNNIYEFTNLSNKLRTDPCITLDQRSEIDATTTGLNNRWDLVIAQLKARNKALEKQLDELEERHINGLLDRWKEKYEPFSQWLISIESEIKSLKEIGNNAVVVQSQQKETQVLMTKIDNQEGNYNDVISIANIINDDALIDDEHAETIEKFAASLKSRWETINDTVNTRSQSLLVRESFLSDQEQHLLHEWRRSVEPFNKWLSKVEEDVGDGFHGDVGVNTIKDYSLRCKTLDREVEGRKPVLEEIEKLGNKLLDDTTVREEEKTHIKEEKEILMERWTKLHATIHDNTKWADIKLIELAKKEQETLEVWKKNVEPFNTWLNDTNNKLQKIENGALNTETLKEKHASLQRLKEDVTGHEDHLTRIVTIADKLTADNNVSEAAKNNIKTEMSRLQDKWNTTQNDINLNYLTITESLMELAQKEKTTLEEWKKQTDPFREWIVEAKGRLDTISNVGDGYDVVSEHKQKLETLAKELEEKKNDHYNMTELKNTILADEQLSRLFRDNIKAEGDSLEQKWNELSGTVSNKNERIAKRMVNLENAQRGKLDIWMNDLKSLNGELNSTGNELKTFDSPALDVDGAMKQSDDLKAVEERIEVNRVRVEEVSSSCNEISNDANVSKSEKTRVKKELDLIKERQAKQTKTSSEHQKRLNNKIRELRDRQSVKLETWQKSSQPLHEWLDGLEDDAKDCDVMSGSIEDAQKQFNELQRLSKEFKDTEPDLFNVMKAGEELSVDPQVSRDVRETVAEDVSSLRENHSNVNNLINSQREKVKSQLLKLQQHQEKSLIDWNQRKSSINARVRAMEKRTNNFQPVGDTFEDVNSQKEDMKATAKELQAIEYEVNTLLEIGEALCKDRSIGKKEKEEIEKEMKAMEASLNTSLENVEKRKSMLDIKLEELRTGRASVFLDKWRTSHSSVCRWIETCAGIIPEKDDHASLALVREQLEEIDEITEKLELFEKEYVAALKCGEDILQESSIEESEKDRVQQELTRMKESWQDLNDKLDAVMASFEDAEVTLSEQHKQDSEKWYNDAQEIKSWCDKTKVCLNDLKESQRSSNYDRILADGTEIEMIVEKLRRYDVRVKQLDETSRELCRNSKSKTEGENFKQENKDLQKDFNDVKETVEKLQENHDVVVACLQSEHGQKLSDWSKKGERLEKQLLLIENKWQENRHLEKADINELKCQRPQLEGIVSSMNNVQPDYERHVSRGNALSNDQALSSETREMIQYKVSVFETRWQSLQIARQLLSQLPKLAVVENVVKVEDSKQVESIDDAFDDLFGIDQTDSRGTTLVEWYMDYETVLSWCIDAEEEIEHFGSPGEYMILVEKQHAEIEELIQTFTSYEDTVTKLLEKGDHMLKEPDSYRLSKDDKERLGKDVALLKTKWSALQELAFDTERRLNEHQNKLREFHDWHNKASALLNWLQVTSRKLDCCAEPSDDPEERERQRTFLQKFAMEKQQNEDSIHDVLNLGKYIVANQLVLKDKYSEITSDAASFKELWNHMLVKADKFCKIFGVEFSHIDIEASDPYNQWKLKVKEVEDWISDANDKLSLDKNLKVFAVLCQIPEDAKAISEGVDSYCNVQLKEIETKGQEIINSQKHGDARNSEITETTAKLARDIETLKLFTESQKVHVRNATLAFFNEKLNAAETLVESLLEDLKKLKIVGSKSEAVKTQVDFLKSAEEKLERQIKEFEETKSQIIEMEDKGYLSSEGFEGTLKVKTNELEPKLIAVEKQFADTKTRLSKGLVNFHGHHKDEVKKWLKNCEKKLSEINCEVEDIDSIYEEYCKIQELRRDMMEGEQEFLSTLELNERLIAEEMFNEKRGNEYQLEMQSLATWRNHIQRQANEKNTSLYTALIDGMDNLLTSSIEKFEEAETKLSQEELSADFDTATEQMDASKRIVENIENVKEDASKIIDLSQQITAMGILILNENDKVSVEEKTNVLKKLYNTLPAKAKDQFNRLFDAYLEMFEKEVVERKNWLTVNENRMSSNYLEIENLTGFIEELTDHQEFENELAHRDMSKMSDAAERVTELDMETRNEVRNMTKRWTVLKNWSDEYSMELRRITKEWEVIEKEMRSMTDWLTPNEEKLSKLSEKVNCCNQEKITEELNDLKRLQTELEEKSTPLSDTHIKGMNLMKIMNEESAGSRTIDEELADLDKRWNTMARTLIIRIELLRNVILKHKNMKEQIDIVNTYIDGTNEDLDQHETKFQRLRGNISNEAIMENGETAREKKSRLKKEKETDQQDVSELEKSLEERIADFPKYQNRVDLINTASKELEDDCDEESKTYLQEQLVTFNARWQVIITRLEEYNESDLPDQISGGCFGFVKRKVAPTTY